MASPQEAKGVGDESAAQLQPSTVDERKETADSKAESPSTPIEGATPPSPNSSQEEGEASPESPTRNAEQKKRGSGVEEESSSAPPLPSEPIPAQDDGWEPVWSEEAGAWYFYNRITQKTQWDNPRVPESSSSTTADAASSADAPAQPPLPVVGGYNPAIHGDYDPNADYAQVYQQNDTDDLAEADPGMYSSGAFFNRETGKFQQGDQGPERHGDEAKSRRQMNSFFDVDAAANSHDGRSLKAERSGKKPSKAELKMFKEKRRAKKEEKRRAWLRD